MECQYFENYIAMSIRTIKKPGFLILSLITVSVCFGQTGGSYTYGFLNLTNSARVAALGSKNISLNDNDLNMPYHNPALLTPEMDQNIVLNYVLYFAQINFGYASYALDMKKIGTFAAGMHYINYGKFDGATPAGVLTGNFYAAEYAFNLFFSRPIDSSFRWGVNLKQIYSSLENYKSYGMALDIGITYTFNDGLTCAAAVIRNIGSQISSYTGKYTEPLPFEILLGITHKLQYAPFRFSLTAQNLQKYKLSYEKAEEDNSSTTLDNTKQTKFEKFADNFFRHIIAGIEFLPSKSLYFSFAYNYQRRKEMALEDSPGTVGFSYGMGIKLKRFSISYGRAVYHAAGGSNHFSFSLNLAQFYHR